MISLGNDEPNAGRCFCVDRLLSRTHPKDPLFELIEANKLRTNDLILSEIDPSFIVRKQKKLVATLHQNQRYSLSIDGHEPIEFQARNLRKGTNDVGVPDLIIMQNVIRQNFLLYTLDSHIT